MTFAQPRVVVALIGIVTDWVACAPNVALAQHASDDVIAVAEDAFGMTLGNDSVGIYNPNSVRGYNPQSAGNVRIDGLYFDQQAPLSNRIIDSSSIRVGIGESRYFFPAPTGIADFALRNSTTAQQNTTTVLSYGPYEARGVSVDGALPLASTSISVPVGVSYQDSAPTLSGANQGYVAKVANFGVMPQWTSGENITLRTFVDWQNFSHSSTVPSVYLAGDALPPRIDHQFASQDWAAGQFIGTNYGLILNAKLAYHWSLAVGGFRSILDTRSSYSDLYLNTTSAGMSDHVVVGYPRQLGNSISGETRLIGHFVAGKWNHDIVFAVRGRTTRSEYGGSDEVDLGPANVTTIIQAPRPTFAYGNQTHDHTVIRGPGVAYNGRLKNSVEWTVGIQKEFYTKNVDSEKNAVSRLTDSTWRGYATCVFPVGTLSHVYFGYTQGWEDSGVAPSVSINRGEILPVSKTWQADTGLRIDLGRNSRLLLGVFQLNKPYFNLDSATQYRELGKQKAQGIEMSLTGQLWTSLHFNIGALIGGVQINGPDLSAQGISRYAYGQPHNQYVASVKYDLPVFSGLSVDAEVYHFGATPVSLDGRLTNPALTELAVGAKIRFKLGSADAAFRIQEQNLTGAYIWDTTLSPGFYQLPPRTIIANLIVDM